MKLSAATAVLLIWFCLPSAAQQTGAALYAQRCAQCHDSSNSDIRAPSRTVLQSKSFDEVLSAITAGTMASFAQGLTNDERTTIASLVTGKVAEAPQATSVKSGQCAHSETGFPQAIDGPRWNGWGADLNNSRFQPAAMAGIAPDEVPRLRLKWAFGFPGTSNANAQPTVVGGLLFVGGGDSKVHALDAKSGCTLWVFPAQALVRTAISVARLDNNQFAIFFGDVRANVYAVNATTGTLIWKSKVDDHPAARVTGAPTFYSGVVYVGVSSIEEVTGSRPTYQCCTFRGSVVALNAETGAQIWKPSPSAKRHILQNRTPSEPSFLVRPARRSGPHRRSMFGARRSILRHQTVIRTPQQTPAMPSWRLISRLVGSFGIGRPRQRTTSSLLASAPTKPIARKTEAPIMTLVSRPSW
jgi:polyvinyl alcohol dehydrogenase (cytochrome)